ncbi:hypothetical protein SAMN05444362_113116 [Dysgonomonas macrotermitis]|uniref:Uncharacterized protein n=1 Tax=Dysgonomonas macrotermitis TaxID=1346286 RepID=A0A1M5GAW4_9BACT|nr:hypothetical protein SAMN05444362_113116 [Dysgonomonas macrotermitis]
MQKDYFLCIENQHFFRTGMANTVTFENFDVNLFFDNTDSSLCALNNLAYIILSNHK